MEKYLLFILIHLFSWGLVLSQEKTIIKGKSYNSHVKYKPTQETKRIKTIPNLKITEFEFKDENGNKIIDAGEHCKVDITIENKGNGTAENVILTTTLESDLPGISFLKELYVGNMEPGEIREKTVNFSGRMELVDGEMEVVFNAIENKGFDAYPLTIKVNTRRFRQPKVIVSDALFSTDKGGEIELNQPVNLKVLVQNIGQGVATDVAIKFLIERANCLMLDTNNYSIKQLESGQSEEVNFSFIATRRYTYKNIPVQVDLAEKYGKYANDTVLKIGLQEELAATGEVIVIEGDTWQPANIKLASLVPDVDRNIPLDSIVYPKRFALIIGNEDYNSKQKSIDKESNVIFARRDAEVFAKYVLNTLGVPKENLFLLKDATAAEMYQHIDLVSKLLTKVDSSELIFYYAGHGLPDENTQIPYMIPVDVSGTNLRNALKLSDVYENLGNTSAKITIFLDACFSGGSRQDQLLASRSIRIKPKPLVPVGNTVVFSASSGEQVALPYEKKQHGMFTYFLLKKLQETSGIVRYDELYTYLKANVSIESLRINHKEQDPDIITSPALETKWKNWKFKNTFIEVPQEYQRIQNH